MRPAFLRLRFAPPDKPLLHRTLALALAAAVHVLLLLMLWRLAPPFAPPSERPRPPVIVQLVPEGRDAPAATPAPKPRQAEAGAARQAPAPAPASAPRPRPPVAPPQPAEPSIWSKVVRLNREEMASADIARFPSKTAAAEGESAAASASGAGDSAALGRGPNGERLYAADWHRRPTRAELSFYLPSGGRRAGWGMIACRTVAGNRVEDCLELGESPPGSGLAGAVRQAAWQFRVRPPRIGGRPLVGAWVRIRIDYSVGAAE